MACLFGHKWNGCKCEKCGKARDEQHAWNGCKCVKCGKTRDEKHTFIKKDNISSCSMCGKTVKETAKPNPPAMSPNQAKAGATAMDVLSAFDNLSRSIGVNVSYGEKTDAKLKKMNANQALPPDTQENQQEIQSDDLCCEKCGTSKASIDKKKEEQQEAIKKAQANGGFFMGGITPSRDFLKCPACSKIACSICVSENKCPFCQSEYTEESYLYKSKSIF